MYAIFIFSLLMISTLLLGEALSYPGSWKRFTRIWYLFRHIEHLTFSHCSPQGYFFYYAGENFWILNYYQGSFYFCRWEEETCRHFYSSVSMNMLSGWIFQWIVSNLERRIHQEGLEHQQESYLDLRLKPSILAQYQAFRRGYERKRRIQKYMDTEPPLS